MNLEFRPARTEEVEEIIDLLKDDDLGSARERLAGRSIQSYFDAFAKIEADPNNHIIVTCLDGKIIGTFQLTYIPSLTHQGGMRSQIEGVRVKRSLRGQGIGRKMFEWAIEQSKKQNCSLVQLTTDKRRNEAHHFYESLGFRGTHEGYKLRIER